MWVGAWRNHGATVDAPSKQDSEDGASPTESGGKDAKASDKRKDSSTANYMSRACSFHGMQKLGWARLYSENKTFFLKERGYVVILTVL